jgi:hypothetical protein
MYEERRGDTMPEHGSNTGSIVSVVWQVLGNMSSQQHVLESKLCLHTFATSKGGGM